MPLEPAEMIGAGPPRGQLRHRLFTTMFEVSDIINGHPGVVRADIHCWLGLKPRNPNLLNKEVPRGTSHYSTTKQPPSRRQESNSTISVQCPRGRPDRI